MLNVSEVKVVGATDGPAVWTDIVSLYFACTFSVKVVECVFPSCPCACTVTGYEPGVADVDADIDIVLVNAGTPLWGLKEADTPDGIPDTDRLTILL